MQLGPQNGFNPISKSAISLPPLYFDFFIFVSVDRTSCRLMNGQHSRPVVIATSLPSTSQLGSLRTFARSLSRVPGVCLNYGNRPRVPAPGFDYFFWNCPPRRRLLPIPISTARTKLHLFSSVASHLQSTPEWYLFTDRQGVLDKAFKHSNLFLKHTTTSGHPRILIVLASSTKKLPQLLP